MTNSVRTFAEASLGAIVLNSDIVIATPKSLVVIDHEGNVIDEITTKDGLNESPLGIALSKSGTPVIRGVNTYWEGNMDLTSW